MSFLFEAFNLVWLKKLLEGNFEFCKFGWIYCYFSCSKKRSHFSVMWVWESLSDIKNFLCWASMQVSSSYIVMMSDWSISPVQSMCKNGTRRVPCAKSNTGFCGKICTPHVYDKMYALKKRMWESWIPSRKEQYYLFCNVSIILSITIWLWSMVGCF